VNLEKTFSDFASKTARVTGRPIAFLICVALVVVWAASGPMFKFSETWQLVINTGTTIITFLMVFLIQNTQNRDAEAMHAKLDELVLTSAAENEFVGIEELTESQLRELHRRCAKAAKAHNDLHDRLSLELEKRKEPRAKTAGRKPAGRAKGRAKA
jgi:low affinity Fe/Cu permease